MKKKIAEIIKVVNDAGEIKNQRELARIAGMSLSSVSQTLQLARQKNFLIEQGGAIKLSDEGKKYLDIFSVDNAIIMAAGVGSRFAPITHNTPKALIKIKGVPIIERLIGQLHEKGIKEIIVVVGYMKEKFEYLAEKYGVTLVYNKDYAKKNNIGTLYHVLPYLKSSYILCADNWLENNFFAKHELRSWYCVKHFDEQTNEWCVTTKGDKITKITIGGANSKALYGPAYFSAEFSKTFSQLIEKYYGKAEADNYYWEDLWIKYLSKLPMYINDRNDVYEFDSLSDLRQFDNSNTCTFMSNLIGALDDNDGKSVRFKEFIDYLGDQKFAQLLSENGIAVKQDASLTNKTYKILWNREDYILRIPGQGIEKYINRHCEHNFTLLAFGFDLYPYTEFYDDGI
ncbi:MAG: NTP transferase domain-containing protein [Firmicutes bacterium]|nr:NTP transferase domain-containing protein [Bacillota bacterium]